MGRQAIVRAAIDEVAERGLSRITYRSVAARAGVTHGSIQHHFSSIENVLEEALKTCLESSLKPLGTVSTPLELIDSILEGVESDPAIHTFQYELILESKRRATFRPHVDRLYEAYWQALGTSLRLMGLDSSTEMVRAVFAAVDGLVFQRVMSVNDHPESFRATTDGVLRLLDNAPRSSD